MRPFALPNETQHFTGTISHYGKTPSGQPATAIANVEDGSGRRITDHVWLQHFVHPRQGGQEENFGKIVSFTAKPILYTRHDTQTQDYGLDQIGRVFRALPVPDTLSPKFRKRLRKHRNRYFAGVIHDHQLQFIGQDGTGRISKTTENTRFFATISELIKLTTPYLDDQTPVIFKVIVYQDILFMGISRG